MACALAMVEPMRYSVMAENVVTTNPDIVLINVHWEFSDNHVIDPGSLAVVYTISNANVTRPIEIDVYQYQANIRQYTKEEIQLLKTSNELVFLGKKILGPVTDATDLNVGEHRVYVMLDKPFIL